MTVIPPLPPGHHPIRLRRSRLSQIRRGQIEFSRGSLIRLAGIFVALIISAAMLLIADGSARDVHHASLPLILLGASLVGTMISLTLASLSDRIRVGQQMLGIYFVIYMLLPGYRHMSMNRFPFYGMTYTQSVRIEGSIIITLFLFVSITTYWATSMFVRPDWKYLTRKQIFRLIHPNLNLAFILLGLSVVATVVLLATIGVGNAFAPRSEVGLGGTDAANVGLFVALPRVIGFASLLYAYVVARFSNRQFVGIILLALNLPLFLVSNFPLALPRFQLFGYALLLLILTLGFRSKVARISLPLLFMVGATVAMPIADALTRNRGQSLFNTERVFDRYFGTGDFDGVQSTLNAVLYTNVEGFAGGRQILSAALFFVPRAVWPGKSEPTGKLTAEAAGFSFTNISQPLPSEFYVDFGMAGVFFGALAIGFALALLDRWIDSRWGAGPGARLVAGAVTAYSIILYRGALLGVIAPIAALILFMVLFVNLGLRPERRRRPKRSGFDQQPVMPARALA